jgi:hypothetical protein
MYDAPARSYCSNGIMCNVIVRLVSAFKIRWVRMQYQTKYCTVLLNARDSVRLYQTLRKTKKELDMKELSGKRPKRIKVQARW